MGVTTWYGLYIQKQLYGWSVWHRGGFYGLQYQFVGWRPTHRRAVRLAARARRVLDMEPEAYR